MNILNYESDGIQFIQVTNNKNLKVIFANLGASLYKVNYDNYVMIRNVKDPKDYHRADIFYGKTIGRTSNRMKGHEFKCGDKYYKIEPNEGKNVLHGGVHGMSNMFFEQDVVTDDEKIVVTYTRTIRESEDGYPGDINVRVRYIVFLESNEIDIQYAAKANKDTVLSLTNHAYFMLGCRSNKGLTLQINADKYLKTDEELLPLEKADVTPVLDFRKAKKIVKDIDAEELHTDRLNGYDHYFFVNFKGLDSKMLTLNNAKFVLDIYSDYEGIQIYSSGFDPKVELYPQVNGLFDSVAIEPSDSFEYLHGLRKDKLYSRTIKYIFSIKE